MRNSQKDERENERRRAAKQYVKKARDQKRDADRRLHATISFARKPARNNRPDSRSDASRREKHTDSTRRVFADRKNFFTKHGEQGQYATANTPCWFHEQCCEHAWSILNVPDTLDRLGYPQQPAQRYLLSFAFFSFGKPDTRNQRRRHQVGHGI